MLATEIHVGTMATPIGPIRIFTDAAGVLAIEFEDQGREGARLLRQLRYTNIRSAPIPAEVRHAIEAYFEDARSEPFGTLRLGPSGTPFQQAVWKVLRAIPAGQTMSYGDVARLIDRPGASRAVGLANGSNPIPLIIPCHRIIGVNRALTGYGSGLHRKSWLLRHEGAALI